MTITHAPLDWPIDKPRTPYTKRKRSAFGSSHYVTMSIALSRLHEQIRITQKPKLQYAVTCNAPIGRRGQFVAIKNQPLDVGVAVYFELFGKDREFTCDKWNRIEDNIVAIAKHINSLRGQDRWGVASQEQAFMGHMRLPAPIACGQHWTVTLGLPPSASVEDIKRKARQLIMQNHPDRGGDAEKAAAINAAKAQALKEYLEKTHDH